MLIVANLMGFALLTNSKPSKQKAQNLKRDLREHL